MKLFHSAHACSQAPYILTQELGLACDIVKTNFSDRTELLKYNTRGQVPTLVLDDGRVLAEGAVIMQYLADQKPEANLLARQGTWERYKTLEAMNYVASELHKSIGALFAKDAPPEYIAFQKEIVGRRLETLNTFFGQNQFMACNQYTIADIYCYVIVGWTRVLGIDMSRFGNILGYVERIGARPAVVRVTQSDSAR
jgi:glutathione S-transferase